MRKKIFLVLMCFTLSLATPINTHKVYASGIPTVDFAAIAQAVTDFIVNLPGTIAQMGLLSFQFAEKTLEGIAANSVLLNQMAALLAVQQGAKMIMGEGDGSIIRDYNEYLYISPQQRAMTQMNSFFNTVSRGRLSSLNYEGVGPNYDAYLVAQARQAIGGQKFSTTLQEQVTDPTQLFATGNMRGIMEYMGCGNNAPCYTLTSVAKYNSELAKQQDIANKENVNGFRPTKKNGRITSPSMLAQSAFLQMDQLGTTIIMNAKADPKIPSSTPVAVSQIWQGAGISLAGRLVNYGIADSKGKEAIRNKNDEFPFSLNYNLATGVGISAGGVTVSTGTGAIASQLQIGNTCASLYSDVNAAGAIVTIQGRKYNCKTKTEVTGSTPSVNPVLPSLTCTNTTACNTACDKLPGCVANFGTLICNPTSKKCEKAF